MKTRRRWSLRARLTAGALAVAACALIAVDVVLPLLVRDALLKERDQVLASVVNAVKEQVERENVDVPSLIAAGSRIALGSEIGWTFVRNDGFTQLYLEPLGNENAQPALSMPVPTTRVQTVGDVTAGSAQYLALAVPRELNGEYGGTGYLVAWVSTASVHATVNQLIAAELFITAALLLALGVSSSVMIRHELRPLEAMAEAADEIAAGDLQRRVLSGAPGTEVGRLGHAVNGMLEGITELVDERTRNEQRLRRFLADASHELRTPLAAMRGYSELYQAGMLTDAEAVDRAMNRMGSEAARMANLVQDLLTLVQTDARSSEIREQVALAGVLTEVVDDAAVIDPSRTWMLVGVEDVAEQAVVLGDRMRLHQVFANLLANVRTHTGPGTRVEVTMGVREGEVAVMVADNGPGVDAVELDRLFDRFYRVDDSRSRERGGNGLGLSIVSAIVRSHGGKAVATPTPGGGLTITVVLPLLAESVRA